MVQIFFELVGVSCSLCVCAPKLDSLKELFVNYCLFIPHSFQSFWCEYDLLHINGPEYVVIVLCL